MKTYNFADLNQEQISDLCRRNPVTDPSIMQVCRSIFADVAKNGDRAVIDYSARFDGIALSELEVSEEEFSNAEEMVPAETVEAMSEAARNIRAFHASQQVSTGRVQVQRGVFCWRESRPVESVGLYVPGGNAVLPSTVLMLAVPAKLAGCPRIIICVPPRKDGSVAPEILIAARLAGAHRVFRIGGAQAVAAMALGTATVPKVDKIVGPGNRWVQSAKLLAVLNGTAIDMVAGPSEVLVIADESSRPAYVAADLIAQAEHGRDSRAILVSLSPQVIKDVERELTKQLAGLPRREFAQEALDASFGLLVDNLDQAVEFSNAYAPEHLILQVGNPRQLVQKIQSAGSVFLGPWSPEVAGDYASGTNHTLPTSGMARAFSGVSLDTFVKKVTFQELTRDGLEDLSDTLQVLASIEGLEGHRRAAEVRLKSQHTRKRKKS